MIEAKQVLIVILNNQFCFALMKEVNKTFRKTEEWDPYKMGTL